MAPHRELGERLTAHPGGTYWMARGEPGDVEVDLPTAPASLMAACNSGAHSPPKNDWNRARSWVFGTRGDPVGRQSSIRGRKSHSFHARVSVGAVTSCASRMSWKVVLRALRTSGRQKGGGVRNKAGLRYKVDTALAPALTAAGAPRRHAGTCVGAALRVARQAKERTCLELRQSRRCRLVVLGIWCSSKGDLDLNCLHHTDH